MGSRGAGREGDLVLRWWRMVEGGEIRRSPLSRSGRFRGSRFAASRPQSTRCPVQCAATGPGALYCTVCWMLVRTVSSQVVCVPVW